jgi:hypothetical protein
MNILEEKANELGVVKPWGTAGGITMTMHAWGAR